MISSSDFMGELSIPLHDLPADQPLSKWFLLAASGTPRPFLFFSLFFSFLSCFPPMALLAVD
jgi:hypothetical protein